MRSAVRWSSSVRLELVHMRTPGDSARIVPKALSPPGVFEPRTYIHPCVAIRLGPDVQIMLRAEAKNIPWT
jgi:hypothetical protein